MDGQIQIIDPVQLAEREFGQPFADVVRGFASDGECPRSIAEMLHCDETRLRRFMRRERIVVDAASRPAHEQTDDTRRRIAGSLRRRAGRPPLEWCGRVWTYPELQAHTGINADTIRMRLNKGWSIHRAVTEPVINTRKPLCKYQ